ncbi:hypothetical protein GCM10027416_08500 [Okibacterium endophyticum]
MSNSTRSPVSYVHLIIALVVALVGSVWMTAPAQATTVTGRGVGYYSADSGGFWLGSWRLDDGRTAFCVNSDRGTPNGGSFTPVDGADWYSDDNAAKLAYISRTWAASADPATAAAGQIATWSITGLGRYTVEQYAAKAGPDADRVLALTGQMLAETEANATRGVTATLTLSAAESVPGPSLKADLIVDSLRQGSAVLPAGAHEGTATLAGGATFADGSTTKTITNGVRHPILQTSAERVLEVSATVRFTSLPYGLSLSMGESTSGAQNLLIASTATATATADAETEGPSVFPFQPVVSTQTSAAEAQPGTAVHDVVTLDVAPSEGHTSEWGVYGPPGGPYSPIPVTIRSRLLGPFTDPVVEADAPPADAPVVCDVQLVVTTGPGEYTTPECTLPAAGYYVWVERIVPGDTPHEQGGGRIAPWESRFGVASEITLVPFPVPETPVPEAPAPNPPAPPELAETGAAGPVAGLLIAAVFALGGLVMMARARASRSARS